MPKITEYHIQRAVCIHLDAHKRPGVEYWHTPNGGSRRDAFEGKRLKEIGLKPGVSDLLLFYAGRLFCLELKDDTGALSTAQTDWGTRMQAQGAQWGWANSLAGARNQLYTWGLTLTL